MCKKQSNKTSPLKEIPKEKTSRWLKNVFEKAKKTAVHLRSDISDPAAHEKKPSKKSKSKDSKDLLQLLKDEINVKEVTFGENLTNEFELDITITPELYAEGMVREITRMVQKLRQDAHLKPKDVITLRIEGVRELVEILTKHELDLKQGTNTRTITIEEWREGNTKKRLGAVLETKLNNTPILLELRKVA